MSDGQSQDGSGAEELRSTASDRGQRNPAAIQPHLSIVIPIYRERGFLDGALTRLVRGLDDYRVSYEILLVEQFSDQQTVDESAATAARFPHVRHLLLPEPNFGRAMMHGMLQARGDVIVNFDIDYWDVTFARMCHALMREFEIDLVIGSKNARLSVDNRSRPRRLISRGFRVVLDVVFGLRVSDTHGIKAWRRSPQLVELIESCHFDRDIFDTELVIRAERAGFRLIELPVTVAEQRAPRSSVLARVPGAAWNLLKLYFILGRESPRRSIARGAITAGTGPRELVEY